MDGIRWGRAILNGFLAWLLGFILYMIPSFVKAFQLVFAGGPPTDASAVDGQAISAEIAEMYASSLWLAIGFIVIIVLLVLWRARAVATGTGQSKITNGLVVGAVPALLTLVFLACGGFGVDSIVSMVLYLGAGALGGYLAKG